jgi:hypothetical protein
MQVSNNRYVLLAEDVFTHPVIISVRLNVNSIMTVIRYENYKSTSAQLKNWGITLLSLSGLNMIRNKYFENYVTCCAKKIPSNNSFRRDFYLIVSY